MQKKLKRRFFPRFLRAKKESLSFKVEKARKEGRPVRYTAVPKQRRSSGS